MCVLGPRFLYFLTESKEIQVGDGWELGKDGCEGRECERDESVRDESVGVMGV